MPLTASTITTTGLRKIFGLISSATTDGSGANTLTIAHGFGSAQGISSAQDASDLINCLFTPVLSTGGLQGWAVIARDATNLIVTKPPNTAGSADNAVACQLVAQVAHSLVR